MVFDRGSFIPCLFILSLETLPRLIDRGVKLGTLKPFSIVPSAPKITHSFYADDSIIYLQATKSNAENLATILQHYCQWSGQLINQTKSILMLTPNIHKSLIRNFTNFLKVKYQEDPGKYLGVPVQWGRVTASTFSDLTDKFVNRMQGWKSTSLNFAGRTTLLKTALDPVSNHLMTVLKLPMKITKLLNRYKREFLWQHRTGQRKLHSIGWDTACQPVETED